MTKGKAVEWRELEDWEEVQESINPTYHRAHSSEDFGSEYWVTRCGIRFHSRTRALTTTGRQEHRNYCSMCDLATRGED